MIFVVAHTYYGKGERLEEALENAAKSGATERDLRDYCAYYVDPIEVRHIWLSPVAKKRRGGNVEWEWSSSADRRKPPVIISEEIGRAHV